MLKITRTCCFVFQPKQDFGCNLYNGSNVINSYRQNEISKNPQFTCSCESLHQCVSQLARSNKAHTHFDA